MNTICKIRALAAHEWDSYKALRLAALADAPEAFGSTWANEAGRSDVEWSRRLAAGANSAWDFPAVAEIDGQLIALAWGRIDPANPEVANLYQFWVAPNHRRLGVGQQLLEAVIDWASARQAHYLDLGVTCGDSPALRLYTRAGFEPVGQPQPLRPGAPL